VVSLGLASNSDVEASVDTSSELEVVIAGSEVVTAGPMISRSDVLATASTVEVATPIVLSSVSSGLNSEATLEASLEVVSGSKLDASVVCESTSEETGVTSELVSGDSSGSGSVSVEAVSEVASAVRSPVISVVPSPVVVPSTSSVVVTSTSSWVRVAISEDSLPSVEAGRVSPVRDSSTLVATSVEAVASVSPEDVADVPSL
jgi:hypothetical protein